MAATADPSMHTEGFWSDLKRTVSSPALEERFRLCKVVQYLKKELDISYRNFSTEMMVEYALGFYLFPTKDWITKIIRPALYENRLDKLTALYSKPMNQHGLDAEDLIVGWRSLVEWIANSYKLNESVVLALGEIAKKQYTDLRDTDAKINVYYHEDKGKWKANPLSTLLSLYTIHIREEWQMYWTSFNGVIPSYINKARTASPNLEPDLLLVLIKEVRAV